MSDLALVVLTVVETIQCVALVALFFRRGGGDDSGLIGALGELLKSGKD